MKRHMNSDHWDKKLDQADGEIKTQRLETIRVKDGKVIRHTVTRQFFPSGEYTDSEVSEIISSATK